LMLRLRNPDFIEELMQAADSTAMYNLLKVTR